MLCDVRQGGGGLAQWACVCGCVCGRVCVGVLGLRTEAEARGMSSLQHLLLQYLTEGMLICRHYPNSCEAFHSQLKHLE